MNSFAAQLTSVAITAGRIPVHVRLHLPPDANALVPFAHLFEETGALDNVAPVTARSITERLRKDRTLVA